jgi:hypothetical protein
MEPRHQHDCDGCVFLGRAREGETDYWLCRVGGGAHTLIRRHSSEGSDYGSSPIKGSLADATTWQRDAAERRSREEEEPYWAESHALYTEALTLLAEGPHAHLMPTVVYGVAATGGDSRTFRLLPDAHAYASRLVGALGGTLNREYTEQRDPEDVWNVAFGAAPGPHLTVGWYEFCDLRGEAEDGEVTLSRLLARPSPVSDRDVARAAERIAEESEKWRRIHQEVVSM